MSKASVQSSPVLKKPVVFYAAPAGNDLWSGKRATPNSDKTDGPFRTVARARDAIRALRREPGGLRQPVTVYIRAGTYFLDEPIVFTPEDSGTLECPITYAAYKREKPVLSGGAEITGWKRGEIHGRKAWVATIPAAKEGSWYFRQLFVNDERRPRPRLPKGGFNRVVGLIDAPTDAPWHQGQDRFQFAGEDIQPWRNLEDVDVVALTLWVEARMPIAAVDPDKRIVTFAKKSVFHLKDDFSGGGARYYVENVFEALDTPGQWYLNREASVLYYLPNPGEQMRKCRFVAPRLEQVMRLEGDPQNQHWVEHIRFEGLSFMHTEWTLPADKSGSSQAAVIVPGAIYLRGARNCNLHECTVAHIGNYAVEIAEGCADNSITCCDMHDLGAGGLKVGPGSARTIVSDNEIGDGGHIFHSAVGVWIGNSGHNQVIHNHIHDLYYTGVSVGWTWGYGPSEAVANRIEHNHIHHVGRGWLSDLGGIYTLGVSPGTVLRYNLIHDSFSATYGGWGIYLDEGSTDIVVENNVVFRTKSGGFHQHYGRENIIRNNIFAFAKETQIVRSREEDHRSFTLERNIIYWNEGVLLGSNWKNGNFLLDRNLYWNAGGEPVTFPGKSLDEWQASGQDVHSIIADPKFVDPGKGNFTLGPDSPAMALGFQPIDMSNVGPRPRGAQ